ncbi:hypothetical protein CSW47_11790 [Thermus scotoductus]|uniref:Aminoacyl-tRNA synthetase class Ia domain-containing protein n=1 Tax=Thermus scotoductus TaxID=37636 RepID=A0A430R3B4_THESC|nr:hypothetical protein CSW47_11785 [Thermus scotoductus]RTH01837.1 hypothetical protein CSW47_11790 [Thermus scotoductus]
MGHAQARSYKDLFPRDNTMRGYYRPRRAGRATHGLHGGLEGEKKLGPKGKREIKGYGRDSLHQHCQG